MTWATRAASTQASTSSQHAGSSSSMPVTWWNGMRARLKTLAISGTGQAAQWASHSPVICVRSPSWLNHCVVNRRLGREVEDDDRHLRPAHHRQHGRRQGVGGDMQEDQVHVGLPEPMPRLRAPSRACRSGRG